jgi:hypothetical protein
MASISISLAILFFLFCVLLGFELRVTHLLGWSSTTWATLALFCFSYFFSGRVSHFYPGLPTYASHIAGITDVYHHTWHCCNSSWAPWSDWFSATWLGSKHRRESGLRECVSLFIHLLSIRYRPRGFQQGISLFVFSVFLSLTWQKFTSPITTSFFFSPPFDFKRH